MSFFGLFKSARIQQPVRSMQSSGLFKNAWMQGPRWFDKLTMTNSLACPEPVEGSKGEGRGKRSRRAFWPTPEACFGYRRSPRTGIVLHSLVRPKGAALAVGFNSLMMAFERLFKKVWMQGPRNPEE